MSSHKLLEADPEWQETAQWEAKGRGEGQRISLCAWRLHPNTRNQAKGMLEVLRLAVWIQSLIRESVCDLLFNSLLSCSLSLSISYFHYISNSFQEKETHNESEGHHRRQKETEDYPWKLCPLSSVNSSCPLMDGLWCLLYFPKQFHKTYHSFQRNRSERWKDMSLSTHDSSQLSNVFSFLFQFS